MLSLTSASPVIAMATAGVEEVVLLTYKLWYHGTRLLHYLLTVTYRPRTTPLTDPRHVHELMFSKLPCFSMAEHGRFLAWILAYTSHTKHTCLEC